MSFHGKANMYPGVESIHKKILSQSLKWNENVNYDWDFIQCFRNLRPQGLWHAISSRSGDAGFLLAFRYFLSTHSTPLKIYETPKTAGLCWIGTFKVIFQHDSSSLSFFVLWLSVFFLIYCLTLSSLVLVPIFSATNRLVPQLHSLLPPSRQIIHSTFKVGLWQTSWKNLGCLLKTRDNFHLQTQCFLFLLLLS